MVGTPDPGMANMIMSGPALAPASTTACRRVPVPAPRAGLAPPLSPVLSTTKVDGVTILRPFLPLGRGTGADTDAVTSAFDRGGLRSIVR
jgi:hypothetical protein